MNKETISKIVKASGIQKGELVLLHFWGELEHLQLLTQFSEAVVSLGASPLELLQSRSRNQKIFTSGTQVYEKSLVIVHEIKLIYEFRNRLSNRK